MTDLRQREAAESAAPAPPSSIQAGRAVRRRALRLFVAAFLAIQLALPLLGLYARGGFPFSLDDLTDWPGGQIYLTWQMFSTSTTPAVYEVVAEDGAVSEVNSVEQFGWLVGRAHYTGEAAERLCARDGVAEVRHDGRVMECSDG